MAIENLRNRIPEYGKDLKLNLSALTRTTEFNQQQLWGALVASAAASQNQTVMAEVTAEAKENLSTEAYNAALAAASIMGMNNVAYRTKAWLPDEYKQVKMGLRMNVIAKPGVEKSDFELWSLVVSAVNGCEHCVGAHEKVVRDAGLTKEQVWEAVRVAATVTGVAQVLAIEEAQL